VIAPADVDVHAVDVVLSSGRAGHELEELDAVLVPRHRVEFLAAEIVLAPERHSVAPGISDVWDVQSLYPQSVTCATKSANRILIWKIGNFSSIGSDFGLSL